MTRPHQSLAIDVRELNVERVWAFLTDAPVNRATIEGTGQGLRAALSGNTVREPLAGALDDRRARVVALEAQRNAVLWTPLIRCVRLRLGRARREIAMHLHGVPYPGQPALDPAVVRRSPPESGPRRFRREATRASVHDRRYEPSLTFGWADDTPAQVGERLLTHEDCMAQNLAPAIARRIS